jgi:hypothetical protein
VKQMFSGLWVLFILALVGLVLWLLGLDAAAREALQSGRALDWILGALCLVWLVVILKAPWDLYFQASEVVFEQSRSRERGIVVPEDRAVYVHAVRRRLGWLAVGAHLFSAALVGGITYFSGGVVGYYFALFYIVSTAFRPMAAGYAYLRRRLAAIGEEARYPRDDVLESRRLLEEHGQVLDQLKEGLKLLSDQMQAETELRQRETYELRQNLHALGREFEASVSRLTDNQELIRGIQAFVRLVAQSSKGPSGT